MIGSLHPLLHSGDLDKIFVYITVDIIVVNALGRKVLIGAVQAGNSFCGRNRFDLGAGMFFEFSRL